MILALIFAAILVGFIFVTVMLHRIATALEKLTSEDAP